MKVQELSESLNLIEVTGTKKDITIEGVYIGDLLSIVMAKAKENFAWITIQTHMNIVAVAELLELSCIIIVENMEIEQDTIEKAIELDIPIFKSKESAYQLACKLHALEIK